MKSVNLGTKAVGSIVKIKVNGASKDFIVVHQGKPSSVYDDSCAGTWLLMQDIYESRQWDSSNTNDYANSTIHSYLNGVFLGLFESNIRNAIKQVKIPYRKGHGTAKTVTSGSNGLSAKIFLLSTTETSFSYSYMPRGEGAELAYFKGCADSDSDSKRVAYLNGSATGWWLRSPGCNITSNRALAALGYLGLDRKAAIDKDVYHLSRLGVNADRIHLWDVELTDGQGNLLENEHIDLMDYLIAKLKERNIHIVITAQTNFGNGYPERNIQTGGFSYNYDKCDMHSNPEAIAAQETYLRDLVKHTNPYTGLAYKDDPSIVGFEINNEPCHSGTKEEVKAYINRMLKSMSKAGNRKPVFYNVSHNGYVAEAYYETTVQGTTYQWYAIGLVSGQTQQGNFLPYVDRYDIPFAGKVKEFNKKARMIYEFDPADIMYSYMYPAMVRTFRTAGFQWITQFAYDPIDLAFANTEYQTHFLNLAYTPNKAISMKIAAEAARSLKRGESYGSYPQDTIFGNGFRVSYAEDLSELNNGEKFYYSNQTNTPPKDASKLVSIAGCGSSPIVDYEGTGAYFIDCLESGVWRLEVMPDAVVVNDPFAKPSLKKEVVSIIYGTWDMALRIPDLGKAFTLTALDKKNDRKEETVTNGVICDLRPGVYLLKRNGCTPQQNWKADSRWNSIRIGEFVAPTPRTMDYKVTHTPASIAEAGKALTINAQVAGSVFPDSVIIYTDKVSFCFSVLTHCLPLVTPGRSAALARAEPAKVLMKVDLPTLGMPQSIT